MGVLTSISAYVYDSITLVETIHTVTRMQVVSLTAEAYLMSADSNVSHDPDIRLLLQGASISFGPVVALAEGTIDIRAGEIHALVGENGAGKSTLVKILAGVYQPDSGEFLLDGTPVHFKTPTDSKAAGISVIYQEPTLFPDLTVAENIFIGRQPRGHFGFIDHAAMRAEARELFATLGVPIDPERIAEGLSIADQQIIEIAKAISLDARVLVMDEPTAALSGAEVDRLFTVARSLRDKGAGILFISHRFDEVFSLSDRITVMRDGKYIATHDTASVTTDAIVREMVGRDISTLFPKVDAKLGETVLRGRRSQQKRCVPRYHVHRAGR